MKSHTNKIKLNELLNFLNVDLGGHSNSFEIELNAIKGFVFVFYAV